MHLDGADLRHETLSVRRSILRFLIGGNEESRIQFSDEFQGDGAVLFKACAEHGLEGIISKQARAPYRSGRTKTWLKCKCFTESIFVVIGTDRDRKTGALRTLLAHPDSEGLNYAGEAFLALDDQARATLLAEVARLTTSWAAFKGSRLTDARWCQPKLLVRVKHLAGSTTLRHATVQGLVQ
jgi:bifunctional non-homologous end joining protein LigD